MNYILGMLAIIISPFVLLAYSLYMLAIAMVRRKAEDEEATY